MMAHDVFSYPFIATYYTFFKYVTHFPGWFCKMLRNKGYENESHLCWENRFEETTSKEQSKRENDSGNKHPQKCSPQTHSRLPRIFRR